MIAYGDFEKICENFCERIDKVAEKMSDLFLPKNDVASNLVNEDKVESEIEGKSAGVMVYDEENAVDSACEKDTNVAGATGATGATASDKKFESEIEKLFTKGEDNMFNKFEDVDKLRDMTDQAEKLNQKLNYSWAYKKSKDDTDGDNSHILKISAPWIQYVNKLKALFGQDPDIKIDYDNYNYTVKLYITGEEKFKALEYLLPSYKTFGNIRLNISLIPANSLKLDDEVDIMRVLHTAFTGNPVYKGAYQTAPLYGGTFTYMMFKKEVVQYFNDDMRDPFGNRSTLYQDIADEIFKGDVVFPDMSSVYFCTSPDAEAAAKNSAVKTEFAYYPNCCEDKTMSVNECMDSDSVKDFTGCADYGDIE